MIIPKNVQRIGKSSSLLNHIKKMKWRSSQLIGDKSAPISGDPVHIFLEKPGKYRVVEGEGFELHFVPLCNNSRSSIVTTTYHTPVSTEIYRITQIFT